MKTTIQQGHTISKVPDTCPQTTQLPSMEELLSLPTPSGQIGDYSPVPMQLMKQEPPHPPRSFFSRIFFWRSAPNQTQEEESYDSQDDQSGQTPRQDADQATPPSSPIDDFFRQHPSIGEELQERARQLVTNFQFPPDTLIPLMQNPPGNRPLDILFQILFAFNKKPDVAVTVVNAFAPIQHWDDSYVVELAVTSKGRNIEQYQQLASIPLMKNQIKCIQLCIQQNWSASEATKYIQVSEDPTVDKCSLLEYMSMCHCAPTFIQQEFISLLNAWPPKATLALAGEFSKLSNPVRTIIKWIDLAVQSEIIEPAVVSAFAQIPASFTFEDTLALIHGFTTSPCALTLANWTQLARLSVPDMTAELLIRFVHLSEAGWTIDELTPFLAAFLAANANLTLTDGLELARLGRGFPKRDIILPQIIVFGWDITFLRKCLPAFLAIADAPFHLKLFTDNAFQTSFPQLLVAWNTETPSAILLLMHSFWNRKNIPDNPARLLALICRENISFGRMKEIVSGNFKRFGTKDLAIPDIILPDLSLVPTYYDYFYPLPGTTPPAPVTLNIFSRLRYVSEYTLHIRLSLRDHILSNHTFDQVKLSPEFCLRRDEDSEFVGGKMMLSFFRPGTDITSLLYDTIKHLKLNDFASGKEGFSILSSDGHYLLAVKKSSDKVYYVASFYPVTSAGGILFEAATLLAIYSMHHEQIEAAAAGPAPPPH